MHRSQHVQMITAPTLGRTHLKSTHVVRKRKFRANDLYLPVMVSGLFQMRKPESKALVRGLALAEAHRLAAQMNYLDNVSYLL